MDGRTDGRTPCLYPFLGYIPCIRNTFRTSRNAQFVRRCREPGAGYVDGGVLGAGTRPLGWHGMCGSWEAQLETTEGPGILLNASRWTSQAGFGRPRCDWLPRGTEETTRRA